MVDFIVEQMNNLDLLKQLSNSSVGFLIKVKSAFVDFLFVLENPPLSMDTHVCK